MTFDDDHCVVEFSHATKRFKCKDNGIEWPPPEKISAFGFELVRVSMSKLTDEQRADMTHVCRGALYKPVEAEKKTT